MARSVWLLGDAPGCGFDLVADAIRALRGVVDHLPDSAVHAWTERITSGESRNPVTVLPNLLVVEAGLAWADDGALLDLVAANQPWSFLPLVVVSRHEDEERCIGTYARGASGWVVLPEAPERAREVAEGFARYWFETTLLPLIDMHARL